MRQNEIESTQPVVVRVNRHKPEWRGWKFMWPFAVVFVGVDNYLRLCGVGQFWASCGRVALFTVVQVPVMLFLSALMARRSGRSSRASRSRSSRARWRLR